MVKFKKKLKPKFWRSQGQFDPEGQGHQFQTLLRPSCTWFTFEGKIQKASKFFAIYLSSYLSLICGKV